jgi:hypothetical protein
MKRRMLTMRHAPVASIALFLGVLSGLAWPFTVDDAFIAVRYAARLATGLGYTFSGGYASDGVTGPLWLLPLVAGARLGLPALQLVPLAKGLSGAASLMAASWLVARAGRSARGAQAAWWVACLCASSLPYVAWSVAGLETGLAALLVSWLLIAVLDRRDVQAGVAVALLAWLRPELALFAGVLLAWSGSLRAVLLAVAGAASLFAFRWVSFGHLLPMTLSAKPALLANGLAYLSAREPRVWAMALLLAIAVVRGGRVTRVLAVALVAHALAVALAGGDWMPARRLFVPIVPAFAFAVARGLRGWRYAPVALGVVVALGVREQLAELPVLREAGVQRARLAPMVCRQGPIGMIDVGWIGVACPQQEIIDLAGLTTPAVAYAPGGHLDKRIDEAWLYGQRPSALVLHSRERPRVDAQGRLRWFAGYPVERRILSFEFVRAFRVREVLEYGPSYFYVVLVPPR